jgi:alkylhydroperoxidase family enzyme
MAVEAGVDRAMLRTLLTEPASLPPPLRDVHAYATQVVRGGNATAAQVAALRAAFGDAAFGELAVNVIGCRIYWALRRTMGAEVACPPPSLDF